MINVGTARPKVWLVLVNWNGWRDTIECLESVFRLDYSAFGAIVCDNASSDGSVEAIAAWAAGACPYQAPAGPLQQLTAPALPKPIRCCVLDDPRQLQVDAFRAPLLLVRTGANLGFGAGNNIGIRIALSDPACSFVWLLNNDTVVDSGCLAHMVDVAGRDCCTGITGSLNCFYDKPELVQSLGGGRFFPLRASGYLHAHALPRADITPAVLAHAQANLEWVSGVSMLVPRRFIERIGEMAECYFLYFEEIDWALRSARQFKNRLAPRALVYHKAGSSTGEYTDSVFAVYTQCRARFKLYRKLLPALLPLCYLYTARTFLVAVLRGRRDSAWAIARAARDHLFER
jgi:GT2 family glycosyltransferase